MARVYFTEHKGKRFLHIDAYDVSVEDGLAIVAKARGIIRSQPEKSVFTFTDVTNARFSPEVTEAMKEYVAGNKPYVVAAAVVGVTGLKQILLNSIMKFTRRKLIAFDTKEQALESITAF